MAGLQHLHDVDGRLSDADSYSNGYSDRHPDCYAYGHANGDTDSYSYPDSDAYAGLLPGRLEHRAS